MRTLELSDDGAEQFVAAMLLNDLDNLAEELSNTTVWHHPEDVTYCKKMRKALKKVYQYYSGKKVQDA